MPLVLSDFDNVRNIRIFGEIKFRHNILEKCHIMSFKESQVEDYLCQTPQPQQMTATPALATPW